MRREKNFYREIIIKERLLDYIEEMNLSSRNKDIVIRYSNGEKFSVLSIEYGVSYQRVRAIIEGFIKHARYTRRSKVEEMERTIETFTEEKFLEKYKELLEQYCKAFVALPATYSYTHFIQPFITMADNLYNMHFISYETRKICFDLYSDVVKSIQKEFPELDIKSLYDD